VTRVDSHAAFLNMEHRDAACPNCIGLLVDNDPDYHGQLLFEEDRATKAKARELFESKKGLFPSATDVKITHMYRVSGRTPL